MPCSQYLVLGTEGAGRVASGLHSGPVAVMQWCVVRGWWYCSGAALTEWMLDAGTRTDYGVPKARSGVDVGSGEPEANVAAKPNKEMSKKWDS